MDEIAVQRLIPDGVAITRHAVNEQPLYLVLLNSPDDEIKVSINLQLLRRIVENLDIPRVNLLFQIEVQGLGIAQDLCRVLIQGDQQAAFTLFQCSFQKQLHAEHGLAGTEMPTTMVVDPSKIPPPIRASSGSQPMSERFVTEVGCARRPRAGSARGGKPPTPCRR